MEVILRLLIAATVNLPEADRPGWWRPWQPRIFEAFLTYSLMILQGCRQAVGKTFLAGLLAVVFILLGYRVCVVLPSLRQGSRILLRRILLWMLCLEKSFGLKRRVNNALEVEWTNGGALMALSSNEAAMAGVQGYTCALLIIDESHEAPDEMFASYAPLVAIAMKEGYGMILILGVGGAEDTVIERKKAAGYHVEFWDDKRVAGMDPDWLPYFTQQERELTPEGYDKNFRCLPVRAGTRLVFPQLLSFADPGGPSRTEMLFAVDVGKVVDETVLAVVRVQYPVANVIEFRRWHGTNYVDQAQELAAHIDDNYTYLPYNVGVEVNGPGEGFADILAKIYPFSGLTRVKTSDTPGSRRKTLWIQELQKAAQRGTLAVGPEKERRELSRLSFEITPEGRYVWPHNDTLSTLWVFQSLTQHAVGV